MNKLAKLGLVLGVAGSLLSNVRGAVIDFTGGTVTLNGGGTVSTNNSALYSDVDYYEQNGFRLDFLGTAGGNATGVASFIGDYYHVGNDVIHGHWLSGGIGNLTEIKITQIGGGAFDLNYFILTSNTDQGGGPASGNERTYIRANGGANDGFLQLLPSENWGFPATQVFLGSEFDDVTSVSFFTGNSVDCFGMDEFYINENAPGVPDGGSTLALLGLAVGSMGLVLRRKR